MNLLLLAPNTIVCSLFHFLTSFLNLFTITKNHFLTSKITVNFKNTSLTRSWKIFLYGPEKKNIYLLLETFLLLHFFRRFKLNLFNTFNTLNSFNTFNSFNTVLTLCTVLTQLNSSDTLNSIDSLNSIDTLNSVNFLDSFNTLNSFKT